MDSNQTNFLNVVKFSVSVGKKESSDVIDVTTEAWRGNTFQCLQNAAVLSEIKGKPLQLKKGELWKEWKKTKLIQCGG